MKTVSGLQFWSHRFRGLDSNDATIRSGKTGQFCTGDSDICCSVGITLIAPESACHSAVGSSANWTKDLDSKNNLTFQNSAITTFQGANLDSIDQKVAYGNGQPALREGSQRVNYAVLLRLPSRVLS